LLKYILFIHEHTLFGYEVPGMILLPESKGAMTLDHSKDMSVRVSTCITYDLDALTPDVWQLWH
jgi:hypothetical protein